MNMCGEVQSEYAPLSNYNAMLTSKSFAEINAERTA